MPYNHNHLINTIYDFVIFEQLGVVVFNPNAANFIAVTTTVNFEVKLKTRSEIKKKLIYQNREATCIQELDHKNSKE